MSVLFVLLLLLIGLPAAAAFLSKTSLLSRALTTPGFDIGAAVVYQRQEVSTHPVADALNVRPSERGEYYYYSLVNYLRVTDVLDDGRICFTPRGGHPGDVADSDDARRVELVVRDGIAAPLVIHAFDLGTRGMTIVGLTR